MKSQKNRIEHSFPCIGKAEQSGILAVIKSSFLAEGAQVECFEKEMCRYIGCDYAIAASTGTSALHLALLALEVGKGDEVILPNYVCRSVLNAVQYCQATPVLCDVQTKTYNISLDEVKEKVNGRTKAIIVAHMFGCPVPVDKLRIKGIPIIEDCAQSIGAQYKGKKVGSLGDIAVFSFEGTKTITTGEGGMVATSSKKLCKKLKSLKEPYANDCMPKYTYRMSSLQAAVGRIQLKRLPGFIKKRRQIARQYAKAFALDGVELPVAPQDMMPTFHRFMLDVREINIDCFLPACWKKKVMVKRPIKPYLLNQYLGISSKLFPNSEYIMKHCVSVPIYPSLKKNEVTRIIKVVCGELKK
ncbi:MAG: DegT/DnrJ/EryC1/StrS family aminotransferase [Candidatus Omnitrophota bacterium]